MNENDMIYNNSDNHITAGGFNVNSLMMKLGVSPMKTLQPQNGGGTNIKVSDIFNGLIIPNWSYTNNQLFSKEKCQHLPNNNPDECNVIDDDVYNNMIEAVTFYKKQKRKTKKNKNVKTKTRKINL